MINWSAWNNLKPTKGAWRRIEYITVQCSIVQYCRLLGCTLLNPLRDLYIFISAHIILLQYWTNYDLSHVSRQTFVLYVWNNLFWNTFYHNVQYYIKVLCIWIWIYIIIYRKLMRMIYFVLYINMQWIQYIVSSGQICHKEATIGFKIIDT